MTFERTFKVKYITSKNCFCYLSDKYSNVLPQSSAGKVIFQDKIYYFSLGDHLISLKDNEIGFNGLYANLLGLKENDCITFIQHDNIPKVLSLDIFPSCKDDLEILELMAENVQDTLLNQIRIVNDKQKVAIWISDSVNVIVDIDGVRPVSPGRIEYLTEVAIRAPISKTCNMPENLRGSWNDRWFDFVKIQPAISVHDIKGHEECSVSSIVFRVLNYNILTGITSHFPFNVYAPVNRLPSRIIIDSVSKLFTMYPIHLLIENDESVDKQKNITVRLCPLDDINNAISEFSCFIPLFIDDSILKYYKLKPGAKVILDSEVTIGTITRVEVLVDAHHTQTVQQQFKSMLVNSLIQDKLVLNAEIPFSMGKHRIMLKFTPDNISTCVVDNNFIRNGEITIAQLDLSENKRIDENMRSDVCIDLANLRCILEECRTSLNQGIDGHKNLEHILVVGKCGTGKTTIATYFSEMVSRQTYHMHREVISCKNIKGKSLDSLYKLFTNVLLKLIYYQPSVLVIDDIHVICENVMEEDPALKESVSLATCMLVDIFEHYLKSNFILLVATAESTSKLNQFLFMPRGNHAFKTILSIEELSKVDRQTFLKYAFSKCENVSKDIDFDLLSSKTEGFVIQDLVDLVEKCVFESCQEDSESINLNHCLNAINTSSSLSLKNVKIYTSGDRDFSNIGGLEEAKKTLIESMMWPAKYSNIFGSSPLRLQSGVLLYGPPGTGKTILAGAAANHCGLRLICVKGPELLSKYIGASEQAVRDIFQKAQAVKPCILFFDEFDSLAPRRGHDITGVTDRVVNQFLTQLDGIESLTGVCVLVATSRPDLLDPALLRPGRIDQQILCPLPTKEERLSIMKALSKHLNFAEDVNLGEIAAHTEAYSGADLQSILYTAQLTSMEHLLNETETEITHSKTPVVIDQNRLKEALNNTRPSLTKEERTKYELIYAKFQGKIDVDDLRKGKQKATLA